MTVRIPLEPIEPGLPISDPTLRDTVNVLVDAYNNGMLVAGPGIFIEGWTVSAGGGGGTLTNGTYDDPYEVNPTVEGAEAAEANDWDRDNPPDSEDSDSEDTTAMDGVELWTVTRVVYNHGGDRKIYGYRRKLTFDSTGLLRLIGAEVRYEIETPEEGCD